MIYAVTIDRMVTIWIGGCHCHSYFQQNVYAVFLLDWHHMHSPVKGQQKYHKWNACAFWFVTICDVTLSHWYKSVCQRRTNLEFLTTGLCCTHLSCINLWFIYMKLFLKYKLLSSIIALSKFTLFSFKPLCSHSHFRQFSLSRSEREIWIHVGFDTRVQNAFVFFTSQFFSSNFRMKEKDRGGEGMRGRSTNSGNVWQMLTTTIMLY